MRKLLSNLRRWWDEPERLELDRASLQAENNSLRAQVTRLEEMLAESLANERKVYQMGVNIEMQQRYGTLPFPNAPHLPQDYVGRQAPRLEKPELESPRSIQQRGIAMFREALQK